MFLIAGKYWILLLSLSAALIASIVLFAVTRWSLPGTKPATIAEQRTESKVSPPPTASTAQSTRRLNSPILISVPEHALMKVPAVEHAMKICDTEASQNPDELFFLVTPVSPATLEIATAPLPPAGENYGSFTLIRSRALLTGIENGSLDVSTSPYEFSLLDTIAKHIEKWSPAKGLSKFRYLDDGKIVRFRIGFSSNDGSVKWSGIFDRSRGNCYWVNLRLPGLPYVPQLGWADRGGSRQLPAPAATIRCANRVCEPTY